jgi:hypothetical protein
MASRNAESASSGKPADSKIKTTDADASVAHPPRVTRIGKAVAQ